MIPKNEFDAVVTEWEAYCEDKKWRADQDFHNEIDTIQKIVGMGMNAIPLIIGHLQTKPDSAIVAASWAKVVEAITGNKIEIPEEIRGKVEEIRVHLIDTLRSL